MNHLAQRQYSTLRVRNCGSAQPSSFSNLGAQSAVSKFLTSTWLMAVSRLSRYVASSVRFRARIAPDTVWFGGDLPQAPQRAEAHIPDAPREHGGTLCLDERRRVDGRLRRVLARASWNVSLCSPSEKSTARPFLPVAAPARPLTKSRCAVSKPSEIEVERHLTGPC